MCTHRVFIMLLATCLGLPLYAAAQTTGGSVAPSPGSATRESGAATQTIYGSQLMTPQERAEYRNRMRAAKTRDEQERLRLQHHREMQARAKERGITLPDEPPHRMGRGSGMGPGAGRGPGSGMGLGGGMGPGGGMNPGGGMGPGAGNR